LSFQSCHLSLSVIAISFSLTDSQLTLILPSSSPPFLLLNSGLIPTPYPLTMLWVSNGYLLPLIMN